ncbi:hypothetical protein FOCC_FOCC013183, partial [Frankliniella occidentalis]
MTWASNAINVLGIHNHQNTSKNNRTPATTTSSWLRAPAETPPLVPMVPPLDALDPPPAAAPGAGRAVHVGQLDLSAPKSLSTSVAPESDPTAAVHNSTSQIRQSQDKVSSNQETRCKRQLASPQPTSSKFLKPSFSESEQSSSERSDDPVRSIETNETSYLNNPKLSKSNNQEKKKEAAALAQTLSTMSFNQEFLTKEQFEIFLSECRGKVNPRKTAVRLNINKLELINKINQAYVNCANQNLQKRLKRAHDALKEFIVYKYTVYFFTGSLYLWYFILCSMSDNTLHGALREVETNFRSYLKTVHVNAESLRCDSHIDEFLHLFDGSMIDVIAVSESWYMAPHDYVQLNGYNVFTADRTSDNGGGVAVYVKNNYSCRVLCHSISPTSRVKNPKPDFIILEITTNNFKLLFACVYRPPKAGFMKEFSDALYDLILDYKYIIVAGDVNAHFLSTRPTDINDGKSVYKMLDLCNLSLIDFGNTYHIEGCDSWLDMISTNSPNRVVHYEKFPCCGLSNHDLLLAVFSLQTPRYEPQSFTFRNFKNCDMNKLRDDALNAPWDDLFKLECINAKVARFNQILLELYDKHAPFTTVKPRKENGPPWSSNDIRSLLKQRDDAYCVYRKSKSDLHRAQYKNLRNRAKQEMRNAKLRYAHSLFESANSSRDMWNSLKKLKVVSKSPTCTNGPHPDELNANFADVRSQKEDLIQANIQFYEAQALTWKPHVTSMCKKGLGVLQRLRHFRDLLPRHVRLHLVNSLVMPILQYASPVFIDLHRTSSIQAQRVQNAGLRFIYNLRRDARISRYLNETKWLNLENRRKHAMLMLVFKAIKSGQPEYLEEMLTFMNKVHNRVNRHTDLTLRVPIHRTDKAKGAFSVKGPLLWNTLPKTLRKCKTRFFLERLAQQCRLAPKCINDIEMDQERHLVFKNMTP